jgi:hypothetical protein
MTESFSFSDLLYCVCFSGNTFGKIHVAVVFDAGGYIFFVSPVLYHNHVFFSMAGHNRPCPAMIFRQYSLLKTMPVTSGLDISAKIPKCSGRSTCTWSTRIAILF